MEKLVLTSNQLREIEPNLFQSLINLQVLDLGNNTLSSYTLNGLKLKQFEMNQTFEIKF